MGTFPGTVPVEAVSPSAWGKGRGVSIKGNTKGQGGHQAVTHVRADEESQHDWESVPTARPGAE